MKKSQLKDGRRMFIFRIEHFVKADDFATALTDRYYNQHEFFPKNLKKKDAEEILKKSLFFFGIQGEYYDGYFEATYEEGTRYNNIYKDALEWVKSKYEWLS
jgi:hypothetical protein